MMTCVCCIMCRRDREGYSALVLLLLLHPAVAAAPAAAQPEILQKERA